MKTPFKTAAVCTLVLVIFGLEARAQTAQATEGSYTLKHRSSFNGQQIHNPFWPIGWEKGAAVSESSAPAESQAAISAENFVVTSISIGVTPLAVINGKTYAEGETIPAVYGGQKIRIQVVAITDGSVVLQYLNKRYAVLLKRPDISSKIVPKEVAPKDNTMILR